MTKKKKSNRWAARELTPERKEWKRKYQLKLMRRRRKEQRLKQNKTAQGQGGAKESG